MSESSAAQPAASSPLKERGPLSDHLYQLSGTLVAASTQDEVLRAVLRCALSPLGAVSAAALLVQGDRLHRAAFEANRPEALPSGAATWQGGPLSPGTPASDSLLQRQTLYFGQAGSLGTAYPDLGAGTGTSAAIVPLLGGGQALGALALEFAGPHDFTADERRFLEALAAQVVLALGRVTAHEELERRVTERTARLEARTASLDAFVQFSEFSATLPGVRELAGHAVEVLRSTLGEVSGAYFEPESGLWRAFVWSNDFAPEAAAVIQAGIPFAAPSYAAAVNSRQPLFVPGWDATQQGVARTEDYGAGAFYPLFVAGEPCGLLAMGVRGRADWTERERSVFRAVGSSLNLALERTEAAQLLHVRNAELNARTQALEGFASLTRGLALRGDPHLLAHRALEVILSLLPPGYGLYYEQEATAEGSTTQERREQKSGHWRSRVQIGDVGNADLQAFIDAGPPIGELPTLDLPWATREALYQDHYVKGTDTPLEMVQHVSTVASLPVLLCGQPAGMLVVALFGERAWTPTDKVVLETVIGSLEQALERSDQARQLEEEARAQEAFAAFTEAVGTETDVLMLAEQAMALLNLRFAACTCGYYVLEDDLWKLRIHTDDLYQNPEGLALFRAGLPKQTPIFLQALQTQKPSFVDGWDPERDQIERTEDYGTVGIYPLAQNGEVGAMLAIGLKTQTLWTPRDRAVFRAVGRGLNLALERAEQARRLREQNAELAARSRALESFAELTQNLPQIREPYALIRRALEVILSLLPPGYAAFWEIEGERWAGRSQVGEVRNPELQEVIDQGFPLGHTPTLDIPRATRQPYFQSAYVAGTDTVPGVAQHIRAVASVPLLVNGQVAGIVTVPLFEARSWSEVDRIVLTTVVQSLGIALERTESVTQLAQRSAELEERGAALARSNEELQAANEELEAFSYSVSHDLRTPVRHIKGFSELARKALARIGAAPGADGAPANQSPSEQATEYMHVVEKAALRMSTLIDAMLDLSRTSRQEMRLGVVDLNLLAARAIEDVQPDTLERVMEWRVQKLPLVMGDRDSLQQVMTNLFSNAVKYSRTRALAVIEVWAEQTQREWSVHVRDNGVGFDANYQDKLFGVFQRLHSEREFEGTGIGLATVRRIVLRHGGRVSARSGPDQTGLEKGVQDQGATFSFTLPKPD